MQETQSQSHPTIETESDSAKATFASHKSNGRRNQAVAFLAAALITLPIAERMLHSQRADSSGTLKPAYPVPEEQIQNGRIRAVEVIVPISIDGSDYLTMTTKAQVEEQRGYCRDYRSDAIWYDRLDALEFLASSAQPQINKAMVRQLQHISSHDQDLRVRELADAMVESYRIHGNFTATTQYQSALAAEVRRDIRVESDINYDAKAIWYDRLEALEQLNDSSNHHLSSKQISDLSRIAQFDDDWRIREAAQQLLNSH